MAFAEKVFKKVDLQLLSFTIILKLYPLLPSFSYLNCYDIIMTYHSIDDCQFVMCFYILHQYFLKTPFIYFIIPILLHIFIFTNSCCVLLSSLHYIIILSLFHYYYRYENHVKCNHEKCNEYIIKFTSSLPNVTSLFQRRPLSHIFTYFRSL